MTRLSLLAVAVVALAGCGASSASPPDTNESAATAAESSRASTPDEPSPTSEADSLLGRFDLEEYNEMLGGDATTATVEGGRIRYVYEVGQVNVEFMIDPSDEDKTILQSSFGISDIRAELTANESDALDTWFRLTEGYQPDATEWIQARLDDYLAAPGAEMTLNEDYGDARAGFYTIQPFSFDDPDPMRPASLVGFYVEDRRALD